MKSHTQSRKARNLLRFAFCLCVASAASAASAQSNPPAPFVVGNVQLETNDPNEDLHDLTLHSSSLQNTPAVSGGTTETAKYVREFYQMQWRAGDPIEVYVIRPKGVVRPPVTIYLYGYPVDANRFRNDAFCELVTRGGVAAIGLVPALTGQRYHSVPMRTWFVSDLHDSIVKTVHDVQMVVSYAVSRPDLDGGRIGIFGQGAGATIAGLAATVDPRIRAVDLLDPWGDWPHWMAKSRLVPEDERANFLKPEHLDPLVSLDPVSWLPKLAGRPLKLDDALFETGTPPEAKARIEAALPASGQLVRYPTQADFDKNALADGKLVAWIQDQLRSSPSGHLSEASGTRKERAEASNTSAPLRARN